MAEVLAQRTLLTACGGRWSLSLSSGRRKNAGFVALRRGSSPTADASSRSSGFQGRRLFAGASPRKPSQDSRSSIPMARIGKYLEWWEKGLQSNMREIESVEDLVDSLLSVGDKLVIVDFFSPGCSGCRALHPKICQFAEMNPDVQFLQVDNEKHKSMCYSLRVHVIPFFRFYRGRGRLCSFSCTIATIQKFKDALAKHKHSADGCSLGPAKGLEEWELLALAANKDLSFNYAPEPSLVPDDVAEGTPASPKLPVLVSTQDPEQPLSQEGDGIEKMNDGVSSSMLFVPGKSALYM